MRTSDHFRNLRHTLATNRVRAALTLLGIVIGTGSIVMLAGLLRGAKDALTRMNQGISETDTLRIDKDEPPQKQLGKPTRELSRVDGEVLDASLLLDDFDVVTETGRQTRATWRGKEKRVRLIGANAGSRSLYRLAVAKGRFLTDEDLVEGRRVTVIGHEVWEKLLEELPNPLGAQLTVDGQSWTIVGVLAHKPYPGHGTGTWMWDRRVLVPQVTFDAIFEPAHNVTSVFMRRREGGRSDAGAVGSTEQNGVLRATIDAAGRLAETLLLRRHLGVKNFRAGDRNGMKQEQLIISIIEILLLGTGLMSLFVGGINIMNIMLVTVSERTREIGIRRAVGATRGAILTQFVLEAGFVSSIGGLLGVIGGIALSWLIVQALAHSFGSWTFHVELWSVGLGMLLAVLTGVTFGLFPAWRAARLRPVDALRYE